MYRMPIFAEEETVSALKDRAFVYVAASHGITTQAVADLLKLPFSSAFTVLSDLAEGGSILQEEEFWKVAARKRGRP